MMENGPGSVMRDERERRGLSLDEVAGQLRLSHGQVEALERDDYGALPGNVFVRGFIRNYARLLQIDPAPLLDAVALPQESIAPPRDEGIPFPSGKNRSWAHYAIGFVLLAFSVLVYEMYYDVKTPSVSQNQAKPAPPLPKPAPAPAPMPLSAPAEASAPAVISAPAANARIHLAFDAASWVEIRDAGGRILFSKLNPPGSEQFVSGTPPFSLTIGNANHVRLSFEDRPVDLAPYARTDVAHLTLK